MKRAWLVLPFLLFACGTGTPVTPVESVPIPPEWRMVRESRGHVAHLDEKVTCDECHAQGKWAPPEVEKCIGCHENAVQALHADAVKTSTKTPACYDCHTFGAEQQEPWNCQRCHAQPGRVTKVLPVHAKEECQKCHLAHSAEKVKPTPCATCHEQKVLHGKEADPSSCRGCHGGHGTAQEAQRVCQSCHDTKAPVVNKAHMLPGHDKCVDCHRPHDVENSGFRACIKCHESEIVDHGKGPSTCVECHLPHQGPTAGSPPVMPECQNCHADKPSHNPKLSCLNCHRRHEVVVSVSTQFCERCHQEEGRPKGHQKCERCHAEPGHQPLQVDGDCRRCHEKQATGIVEGHQECLSCHKPHGQLKVKGCDDCHAKEATSLHVLKLSAQVGPSKPPLGVCAECHRPHDANQTPTCESCHASATRPGLHASRGHQDCQRCHGGHQDPPFDTRAACLSCHQPQLNHEPKAPRCGACHPFRD